MTNQNATTQAQESSNKAQQAAQVDYVGQWLTAIPFWLWILFVVLGAMAAETIPTWLGVVLIIGGYLWNDSIIKKQQLAEAKARAASFANLIGPVIIASAHPGESVYDVAERAAFFKEQLRLSGNQWVDKLPIIEMPYQPILTQYGQLPAAWSIYQKQVGERQHAENLIWFEKSCPNELKGLFANAVLPAPKMENQA
jgi:hypothetical protein